MENSKRFYWIKLKTNFFSREDIDFLLSQKNGCEYVVLYQMLCLNTANNDGRLESKIGELIVPFNAEKIVRDCKYFDIDTVNVAINLYRKLGLIYEEENEGILKISNYDEMVGSESSSAKRVREWRLKKENEKLLQCNINVIDNVTQEYRDKSIEYRDIDNREEESVSVSVSNANFDLSDTPIGELFNRHEIKNNQIQKQILGYLNDGMELEVINNALMIPYDRNVMNFDLENEEAPIDSPLDYGLQILENWFNFGVRTMYDVKKYNKLNKHNEVMLGGVKR
jgi:predicted phage replisome organizer